MTSLTVQNLDLNKNTQAGKYSRATEKEQASKRYAFASKTNAIEITK